MTALDLFQAQPGPHGAAERWAATLKPAALAEWAARYARWTLKPDGPAPMPPPTVEVRATGLVIEYIQQRFGVTADG